MSVFHCPGKGLDGPKTRCRSAHSLTVNGGGGRNTSRTRAHEVCNTRGGASDWLEICIATGVERCGYLAAQSIALRGRQFSHSIRQREHPIANHAQRSRECRLEIANRPQFFPPLAKLMPSQERERPLFRRGGAAASRGWSPSFFSHDPFSCESTKAGFFNVRARSPPRDHPIKKSFGVGMSTVARRRARTHRRASGGW